MSVEFIGFVGNQNSAESIQRPGAAIDRDYIETSARVHETGGFDRVLLAFHADAPESLLVGQHVAQATERLGLLIAHRPGNSVPTSFARQVATLDQLTLGRVAVRIIAGGDEADQGRDGTHPIKDERYVRVKEYLDVVRAAWTREQPFDYAGTHYRVDSDAVPVKPYRAEGIPIYFGGSSDAAVAVAGQHADVHALWAETHAELRQTVARVRAAAAPFGRDPRFSLSLRPILADTEAAAWAKADAIVERAKAMQALTGYPLARPAAVGSLRVVDATGQRPRLDKRLWSAMAMLTGAKGNSISLVGTPDQVADTLADYHELGVTSFLIRGFDPLADAETYGRELLPRVRQRIAERKGQRAVAAE